MNNKFYITNFFQVFILTITLMSNSSVMGNNLNCLENCIADSPKNTTMTHYNFESLLEGLTSDCDSNGNVQMTNDETCTIVEDVNIPNNGDGNGDGIKDNKQGNVVSLPDSVAGDYLTLEVDSICSIDDVYTNKAEAQNDYNAAYKFPQGMMYFELGCAETDVIIYFHALQNAQNPILQKYGTTTPGDLSTLDWFIIPNVTFGTVTIDGKSVVTATYHLVDGELGDNTGVDGRIIDPVGLTFNTGSINNIVSFVSNNASASTQLGNVGIPISRLGTEGIISVDYTTVDGTAIAGQDYQPISGTLNWTDGELSSKTVTINLLEGTTSGKTLSIQLSNLTPSNNAVLALDSLSITITDNPPVEEVVLVEEIPVVTAPVEEVPIVTPAENIPIDDPGINNTIGFISKGYISYKDKDIATITVNRTGTEGIVLVDYTTIDGTATAGLDYQPVNGTLTWANGEEGNKSFDVAMLDTATLGNSLMLSLSHLDATKGQLGVNIAVLTILDIVTPITVPTEENPTPTMEETTTEEETTASPSIAENEENVTSVKPTVVTNEPSVVQMPSGPIKNVFNAGGDTFVEKTFVEETGSISLAIFEAEVENNGLISNSTVAEDVTLTGGKLSGDMNNEGTIANIEFVGKSLTGGTLSGTITNNSQIGGIIEDVQLAPNTTLIGGKIGGEINAAPDSTLQDVQLTADTRISGGTLAGEISGDPNNPPIITAANIAPGTVLSNVRISPSVDLPDDVILGPGVILPSNPPTLEDFGFEVADIANLDADSLGELEPAIFGVLSPENLATISPAAISNLSPEQLAEVKAETLASLSLEQFEQIPVEALSGLTADNMGGMPTELMGEFSGEQLAEIKPEALAGIEEEQLKAIPPEAMSEMAPEQMAELPKEALGGLSTEQFEQLPAEALSGLKSDNMGGLSTEVLNNFTPEHLSALDAGEFTQMASEDVSKLFTNFDADKISIQNAAQLVPPGWKIDLNTGAITAPEGAKLTPRAFSASGSKSSAVKLPKMADIGKGIGLGGQGSSIKDNMKHSLAQEDLTDFVLSQNEETGILWVEGTGDSEGIKYTFIPDVENVIQVDGDKVPIGLAVAEGGFYTITTPDEKQYKVIPSPQDPIALSETLDGGEVVIGKRGDVLLEMSSMTRQRGDARLAAIFEPFIEPVPEDICVEITPDEVVCDFDNAPDFMKPGLHFDNIRSRKLEQAKVVYPDGTSQTMRPTLLSPDVFIEEGLKYEGVENIIFNSNGIFYALHKGNGYLVIPNFKVETQPSLEEETVEPNIVVNEDSTLTYTIAIEPLASEQDSQTETRTRNRSDAGLVAIFEPTIEPAPEDMCVEIMPGEIVCDFDKMPPELSP